MVLADQYLQGEYIAPVVFPEEITAGNWVNYHTSILETFFPWDRCNMRWDEAIMPWQEDDDRHPCVAETQIATFQGLGRYLAALELDGSVSGKNTEPKEIQHVSYAMGRFHKGIRLGDDVRASWETKIPSVFYLGFNARLQSSIHEHCVFLTLKGEEGFLRLGFDGEFYLLDHLGQKNVVSLEAEPGDIVVFRIEQTESERRLVVRTLSLSRESMDNRAFLPVGEWDEIRLG